MEVYGLELAACADQLYEAAGSASAPQARRLKYNSWCAGRDTGWVHSWVGRGPGGVIRRGRGRARSDGTEGGTEGRRRRCADRSTSPEFRPVRNSATRALWHITITGAGPANGRATAGSLAGGAPWQAPHSKPSRVGTAHRRRHGVYVQPNRARDQLHAGNREALRAEYRLGSSRIIDHGLGPSERTCFRPRPSRGPGFQNPIATTPLYGS
jgi:hypothetical protein